MTSLVKGWRSFGLSMGVVALMGLVRCGGVDVGSRPTEKPAAQLPPATRPMLLAESDGSNEAVAFPPNAAGRRDRTPLTLASHTQKVEELRLAWPSTQNGTIEIDSRTLRLGFNMPMKDAAAGDPAGKHVAVSLRASDGSTTAIAGSATWRSEREIAFVADGFLDPKKTYEVSLSGIESTTGKTLPPLSLKLRTRTGAVIAGKSIGHVPKVGVHRVVAVTPRYGPVHPKARFVVLFDQRIDLATAKSHVHLLDQSGNDVPMHLRHAPRDLFDGVRVDRRFVVVGSAKQPLTRGATYKLDVMDNVTDPDAKETTVEVSVARELALQSTTCGYYLQPQDVCSETDGTIETNRPELHLLFNNRIGMAGRKLDRHVQVAPFVRNLVVRRAGWRDDGRIVISGDFRPSVRYRVTVAGIVDEFEQPLKKPVTRTMKMSALGASVTMPEGRIVLDEERTKQFELTSRNVSAAKMRFWKVDEGDVDAFEKAMAGVKAGTPLARDPDVVVDVPIKAKSNELVRTSVDLSQHLDASASWLATVGTDKMAFGASPTKFPAGSAAARPPIALIKPGDASSVAVHVHSGPASTLVHVAKLATGEPVKDAEVSLASIPGHVVKADGQGVAVLADIASMEKSKDFVVVRTSKQQLLVPLARLLTTSRELFPDMERSGRSASSPVHERVVMLTDRGIYRPGATVRFKASFYQPKGMALKPLSGKGLRMKVIDPRGKEVCRASLSTSKMGSTHSSCKLPHDAKIGMHRIQLRNAVTDAVYAEKSVRVAEFEPPRFKVDVKAAVSATQLDASVAGRYLFGAPMGNAWVQWQLERSNAPFPRGAMTDAGLSFREQRSWYDRHRSSDWVRTGESTLNGEGKLAISQALSLDGVRGPQRITLKADVADKSFRHVAGKHAVVVHPAEKYAGVKLEQDFAEVGSDLPVSLGVIDKTGRAVTGETVTAKLVKVRWRHVKRRGPGGSVATEWRRRETEVARCTVTSGPKPVPCSLRVSRSGDFRVVASLDGRAGGSRNVWAYGKGQAWWAESAEPSAGGGRTVQVSLDRVSYAPGDKAKVVVRSPFKEATAILTVEQGGLLHHEAKRVKGAAAIFEVEIQPEYAPQVHVTATLLPIGGKGKERTAFRVGAATVPVKLDGTRLGVTVSAKQKQYRPGEMAQIDIEVRDGKAPRANAEVALAVVDEGVLRLTAHKTADPIPSLRPALNLELAIRDSRGSLADLFERSHVAGDGGRLGDIPNTRRKFVQTALWKPVLVTDDKGKARVRFKLPDNLTEFRVMVMALDDNGKGGVARDNFVVTKDVLVTPLLPRFAHVGDEVEMAAMVHNNTGAAFEGTLSVGTRKVPVKVAAHARKRVGLLETMHETGSRRVRMVARKKGGSVVDSVERVLRVGQPGIDVHPMVSGSFSGERVVNLAVPEVAQLREGAMLDVRVGENMWPELSERIEYLLRYPHGCVEQTTSSTLPLLAARDIFPRIGADHHSEKFYRDRVAAGLKRLASMRTASGGLAYWPGNSEANLYGTTYAMRAFVIARRAGLKPPAKVMKGMEQYLRRHVLLDGTDVDMRALMALSLAELESLPPGILDTLYARRGDMSLFGRASLALALGISDFQRDRVGVVLDAIEAGLHPNGNIKATDDERASYGWYGSATRTHAQIAMALTTLRPASPMLPELVRRLADVPTSYSTQGTAYSLVALAEHLTAASDATTKLEVVLDGEALEPHRSLPGGGRAYRIALADLRGKKRTLKLTSAGGRAIGYVVRASYGMPLEETDGTVVGASAEKGPDVYRLFTTAAGAPIDLADVRAGQLVRVALLAKIPKGDDIRRGYLAITDRLPAGFEPVQPELATVASAPDVTHVHPLYHQLRYRRSAASHLEVRDDRVQIYFDRISSYRNEVVATYLARATTPGQFALPPASAELMYQPNSTSYSAGGLVRIRDRAKKAAKP